MEKENHDGIHSRMLNHGREAASALVLGTAQLGLDYGVANRNGRPRPEEALEIVRRAWEGGIRYFDTAQAYGESETVLGRCFREMMGRIPGFNPKVISKLHPDIDPARMSAVIKEIDASLDRLGVEELWGFMLHRESCLDMGEEALSEMIRELKKEPRFRYFGVSVYSPEYALRALGIDEVDFVQLPYNVFDQRAFFQGVFDFAREHDKKVFVRSIYLQGLLLMNPEELQGKWTFSRSPLESFTRYASSHRLPPKLLALAFVVRTAPGAMFVIGAETPDQVSENLTLFQEAETVQSILLAGVVLVEPDAACPPAV
ncbi:MAG: aldo/keto reductase [Deltaproteobacteria bacterium]|nr:aldo/keto reductase [Deltaproteobacteria bacterium]